MADLRVKVQQHLNTENTLNARREQDAGASLHMDKRKREQQATLEERGSQEREGNDNREVRPQVNLPLSRF